MKHLLFLKLVIISCAFLPHAAATPGGNLQDTSGKAFFANSLHEDTLMQNVIIRDSLLHGYPLQDSLLQDSLLKDTIEVLHPLEWDYVQHDEKIDVLLHFHRDAVMDQLGIPGFRVHLYMDSGNRARLNTQQEQADFEELYPGQASYIVYEEPYFKLRAGDFRTRLDARRFLEKIRKDYPAAYIVVDLINYPELD